MSFLTDAAAKKSYSTLFTNLNVEHQLEDCIMDELNVRSIKKAEMQDFCNILFKPNIPHIKSVSTKLIPKITGMIKQNINPIGQTIDGFLIDENFIIQEPKPKEGVNCGAFKNTFVALEDEFTVENLHDGLVKHLIREVNDFRKELNLNISDKIILTYYFDFDRYLGNGNLFFCRAFRNNSEFIKGEVLADEFFESISLDYFTQPLSNGHMNVRWYEEGGIRILKVNGM